MLRHVLLAYLTQLTGEGLGSLLGRLQGGQEAFRGGGQVVQEGRDALAQERVVLLERLVLFLERLVLEVVGLGEVDDLLVAGVEV